VGQTDFGDYTHTHAHTHIHIVLVVSSFVSPSLVSSAGVHKPFYNAKAIYVHRCFVAYNMGKVVPVLNLLSTTP
jgi:hypothetical protein